MSYLEDILNESRKINSQHKEVTKYSYLHMTNSQEVFRYDQNKVIDSMIYNYYLKQKM